MEGVEIIQLNGFLDAYEKMDFFKRKVEEIRAKRNELLLKTDYLYYQIVIYIMME